jgi:predicted nucleic acid-binding protein
MIFLDTSFIVACKIEEDSNHKKSIECLHNLIEKNNEEVITSDYVFDETITVIFGKTNNLEAAIDVGDTLKSAATILKVDGAVFEETWRIFKEQKGTKLNFTDCSIITLMKKERIQSIATFDKEFLKIKEINVVN